MRGFVGVVSDEGSRHSQFWADLNVLQSPDGVEVMTSIGGPLALGRNCLVRRFLATDAQWLLMIDDDHTIPADFLLRLLQRPTVPILGSLYLTKRPPFQPALYGAPVRDAETGAIAFPCQLLAGDAALTGVQPVYAVGTSGLLVQRSVYETLADPWYELGQSDNVGEDLWFCHKAQQAGIPVHVDLESRLGHLAPFAIWPDVIDDQWVTSLRRDWLAVALDPARGPEAPVEMQVG